ncbi:sulfatase [Haliangium sp.]|uniref:sulfatase n=1 Tax=Haliangium sp. TaxID=2663208 RepID=UPI003D11307C
MTARIGFPAIAKPLPVAAALVLVLVAPGCKSDSEINADNNKPGATATAIKGEPAAPKKKPSVRPSLEPFRPLLDEAARAELDIGGLFIDLGTADQNKYTRGGWGTGWGQNKQIDGVSAAEADDRRIHLDVLSSADVAEVVVRARSATKGQAATVWVDGERQEDIWLETDWTVMRVPVKAGALAAGRHNLQLTFTKGGTPRAELDWVWLAREAGAEPPAGGLRVLPLRVGNQPKRALIAPTSRTYSFFLQPPDQASLVFDYASDQGASFEVRVQADGKSPATVYEGKGTGEWAEAKVDLAAFAGQAIRLDLVAAGTEGITGWGEPAIMVPPTDSAKPAVKTSLPGRPKNVILILIDTVRAESFEAVRPGNQVVTPVYDAFAERSTVFVNAYNNENWTKPSVATTLTGLYPSTHDTKKDESKLSDEVELISERLSKQGFATAGFVANGYVSDKFGFEQGWDSFRNYIRENRKSEAEYVYGDALSWVTEHKQKAAGKPFFLYIQTIDPHVTYKVERPYTQHYFQQEYSGPLGPTVDATELQDLSKGKRTGTEADLAWLRALYHGEVTYHDEHMGKFFTAIEGMGLFEDTLIVITNDHGEELGDHGKFGHGHTLFDELLRSPLLMHFPGLFEAGAKVPEVVETVDITPTILDALGLEPLAEADGSSLLPLIQGKPVQRPFYAVSEFLDGRRAVHVGNWKLMRSTSTWAHLYNVANDFDEDENLIETALIARRMCEVHLGEGLATPDKSKRQQDITTRRKFQAGQADIDPVMRKQLEALGYFGE